MRSTRETIDAYIRAFNAHDAEGLLATLAPGVVHHINEGPTEVGIEAFRAFKAHMDRCYREQLTEVAILAEGNRGAAEFVCSGTYLATDGDLPPAVGQTYAIPAAAFFEVEDGLITRVTSYYNLKQWIAAVASPVEV